MRALTTTNGFYLEKVSVGLRDLISVFSVFNACSLKYLVLFPRAFSHYCLFREYLRVDAGLRISHTQSHLVPSQSSKVGIPDIFRSESRVLAVWSDGVEVSSACSWWLTTTLHSSSRRSDNSLLDATGPSAQVVHIYLNTYKGKLNISSKKENWG